jgi:hypothetical protein
MSPAFLQVNISENCCFIVSRHWAYISPTQAWKALSAHPSAFTGWQLLENVETTQQTGNVNDMVQVNTTSSCLDISFLCIPQVKMTSNIIVRECFRKHMCCCGRTHAFTCSKGSSSQRKWTFSKEPFSIFSGIGLHTTQDYCSLYCSNGCHTCPLCK